MLDAVPTCSVSGLRSQCRLNIRVVGRLRFPRLGWSLDRHCSKVDVLHICSVWCTMVVAAGRSAASDKLRRWRWLAANRWRQPPGFEIFAVTTGYGNHRLMIFGRRFCDRPEFPTSVARSFLALTLWKADGLQLGRRQLRLAAAGLLTDRRKLLGRTGRTTPQSSERWLKPRRPALLHGYISKPQTEFFE